MKLGRQALHAYSIAKPAAMGRGGLGSGGAVACLYGGAKKTRVMTNAEGDSGSSPAEKDAVRSPKTRDHRALVSAGQDQGPHSPTQHWGPACEAYPLPLRSDFR